MNTYKFLLLLVSSLCLFTACTKKDADPRDTLLGDWKVATKLAYLKNNKEIATSDVDFFLNLKSEGVGYRSSLSFKDTLNWAYQKSPEQVFIVQHYGLGYTPSAEVYTVLQNDVNNQIWEVNSRRYFYIDTGYVLTDYRLTWNLTRR